MSRTTTANVTAAANRLKASLTGQDREDLETVLQYARDLRSALADNNAYVLLRPCSCGTWLGHKCERCMLIAANAKVME
ncbi:hypothetical protein [Humidesulfovibrio idahonensis]